MALGDIRALPERLWVTSEPPRKALGDIRALPERLWVTSEPSLKALGGTAAWNVITSMNRFSSEQ